jgi:hypothetical protein
VIAVFVRHQVERESCEVGRDDRACGRAYR